MRAVLLAVCLVAAGCGGTETTDADDAAPSSPAAAPSASPSGRPTPRPEVRHGTEIITADSEYGTMLFDGSGQPIYLFTAETEASPACYDDCAGDWPPVLTRGEPSGSGAVRDALLGTTRRADGRTQVTYAGHPLYFYAHEGKYEVLCHDVEEYGGTWLVVQPDGTAAPG